MREIGESLISRRQWAVWKSQPSDGLFLTRGGRGGGGNLTLLSRPAKSSDVCGRLPQWGMVIQKGGAITGRLSSSGGRGAPEGCGRKDRSLETCERGGGCALFQHLRLSKIKNEG